MQGLTLPALFAYSVPYPELDLPAEGKTGFAAAFEQFLIQDATASSATD